MEGAKRHFVPLVFLCPSRLCCVFFTNNRATAIGRTIKCLIIRILQIFKYKIHSSAGCRTSRWWKTHNDGETNEEHQHRHKKKPILSGRNIL